MKRRFYTLDVFTNKAYAGNPLAVIIDGDGLSQGKMQAIAREMNLSETVFIQRPTVNRALARLRIFTTTRELPFAGHPVVGTWFLMAELGVVPAGEGPVHVWQQTGAGVLPVEIAFHNGKPVRVTMTQRPARFFPEKLPHAALMGSLGLRVKDLHPTVDGFDALSKIADHQPDIVFVDIMMPRLDGYQTCSLIKHNKVFRSIPVIMLSSKDGLFDRARGRIVGSEHYLTKPFTDELLSAIEQHVAR